MLIVTAFRYRDRMVVVADTDDMVLEAISFDDYINFLLNGGKIANLNQEDLDLLLKSRDSLSKLNIQFYLESTIYRYNESKSKNQLCLHHTTEILSEIGLKATPDDGMFFFRRSGSTAKVIVWVNGSLYNINLSDINKVSFTQSTLHIECNDSYITDTVLNQCLIDESSLALRTFSGKKGVVKIKLKCDFNITATETYASFMIGKYRDDVKPVRCSRASALRLVINQTL